MNFRSMTGFATASANFAGYVLTVEIKSVNHKYTDIKIKLPLDLQSFEFELSRLLKNRIARGKIDLFISKEMGTPEAIPIPENAVKINMPLAKAYINALHQLMAATNILHDLNIFDIINFEGVLIQSTDLGQIEGIGPALANCLNSALTKLLEMSFTEGKFLQQAILKYSQALGREIEAIELLAPTIPLDYQTKLMARINKLLTEQSCALPIEGNQLLLMQEVASFADKCDISEEISRLKSHLAHLHEILTGPAEYEPIGKKLDFIIQEILRETNTIGSKGNNIEISQRVIEMKNLLEKIREQIQNIE